jgi:putative aldouronate transport system permease protein
MQLNAPLDTSTSMQNENSEMPVWSRRQPLLVRWMLTTFMVILAVLMIFPFLYILSTSFASFQDTTANGILVIPQHPTLEGYKWLWNGGVILPAFGVSVIVTAAATLIGVLLTAALAYGLSLRGMPGSKFFLWVVILTMLISAGLIPNYLLVRQLNLLDTLWALILPGVMSGFNVIVMRQFFMNIPQELIDCAHIDGANDWQVLWHVVMPLSKAVVAVIALFTAVAQWNSFFKAILYLSDSRLYPLSLIVRMLVLQGQTPTDQMSNLSTNAAPPPELALQMAAVVVTTVPILLIYPFLQKHFTKGVLTGSIKG